MTAEQIARAADSVHSGLLASHLHFVLLAGIVFVVCSAKPRLSPRVRHALWFLVLLRLALPVELPNPWGQVPSLTQAVLISAEEGENERPAASILAPAPEPDESGSTAEPESAPRSPIESQVAGVPSSSPDPEPRGATFATISNPGVVPLVGVWLVLGFSIFSIRMLLSSRHTNQTLRVTNHVPNRALQESFQRCLKELDLEHRKIELIVTTSDSLKSPTLAGLRNLRLLIPPAIESWTQDDMRAVFLHELGHVKRRDPWGALALLALESWHFFNPLVFFVTREVRRAREQACDDLVISRLGSRRQYARVLLQFAHTKNARHKFGQPTVELPMAARRGPLAVRLRRLLDPNHATSQASGAHTAVALLLVATLGLVAGASPKPVSEEPESEEVGKTVVIGPEVGMRLTAGEYFETQDVSEAKNLTPKRLGGDLDFGGFRERTKPDFSELQQRRPDLLRSLLFTEELRIEFDFFVDTEELSMRSNCEPPRVHQRQFWLSVCLFIEADSC